MSAINWGIIGCGDVTEKKSGPAFNKVANSKLIAVMRRDAAKAADYAQRHNVGKWYDDAETLMNDAEINAIYIATPPASHLPYALSALQKGFNVYVEKPVTRNAAEAQQMAEAVKQGNSKLVVAHYRRAVPMFLHVKKLLDDNAIGDVILHVEVFDDEIATGVNDSIRQLLITFKYGSRRICFRAKGPMGGILIR